MVSKDVFLHHFPSPCFLRSSLQVLTYLAMHLIYIFLVIYWKRTIQFLFFHCIMMLDCMSVHHERISNSLKLFHFVKGHHSTQNLLSLKSKQGFVFDTDDIIWKYLDELIVAPASNFVESYSLNIAFCMQKWWHPITANWNVIWWKYNIIPSSIYYMH